MDRYFDSLGLSWAVGSAGGTEKKFRAQVPQALAVVLGSFSC